MPHHLRACTRFYLSERNLATQNETGEKILYPFNTLNSCSHSGRRKRWMRRKKRSRRKLRGSRNNNILVLFALTMWQSINNVSRITAFQACISWHLATFLTTVLTRQILLEFPTEACVGLCVDSDLHLIGNLFACFVAVHRIG